MPKLIADILSIDALYDGCGWQWDSWYKVGEVDLNELNLANARQVGEVDLNELNLANARQVIDYMRESGFIDSNSKGRVGIQYNVVLTDRRNGQPLYAIVYGAAVTTEGN